MTTIAANLAGMAADTQATYDDIILRKTKIRRINDSLVACAGDTQVGEEFMLWFEDGQRLAERPDDVPIDDFEALVLNKEGLFWYGSRWLPEPIKEGYFAIGSGTHIAYSFLTEGKSPRYAVDKACKIADGMSHPIQVEKL